MYSNQRVKTDDDDDDDATTAARMNPSNCPAMFDEEEKSKQNRKLDNENVKPNGTEEMKSR